MKTVTFEAPNKAVNKISSNIINLANETESKDNVVSALKIMLPTTLKVGSGGSHVWVANKKNERILIITGY